VALPDPDGAARATLRRAEAEIDSATTVDLDAGLFDLEVRLRRSSRRLPARDLDTRRWQPSRLVVTAVGAACIGAAAGLLLAYWLHLTDRPAVVLGLVMVAAAVAMAAVAAAQTTRAGTAAPQEARMRALRLAISALAAVGLVALSPLIVSGQPPADDAIPPADPYVSHPQASAAPDLSSPPGGAVDLPRTPVIGPGTPPKGRVMSFEIKYDEVTLRARTGCQSTYIFVEARDPSAIIGSFDDLRGLRTLRLDSFCDGEPTIELAHGVEAALWPANAARLTPHPQTCADQIRTSPLPVAATVPAHDGIGLCVLAMPSETERNGRVMAYLRITGVDGPEVTVEISAWVVVLS
jgi:hypothetical protein